MAEKCCLCQKDIDNVADDYYNFPDGRLVHVACWKCARCSKPLGKFCKQGDVYVCEGCVREDPAVACSVCHKEIEGGQKYKEYSDGRMVHRECLNEPTIMCGVCKKEISGEGKHMRLTDGREVHWECWRCTDCRVYLVDYYLRNERDPYCGSCYRKHL